MKKQDDSENLLNISWAIQSPPVEPNFALSLRFPPLEEEGIRRDFALGWPRGTSAILDEAFRIGLSRFDGWEVSCEEAEENAFESAASVYKRGVHLKFIDHSGESRPNEEIRGEYAIRLATEPDLSFWNPDESVFYVLDQNLASRWPELKALEPHQLFLPTELEKTLDSVAAMQRSWSNFGERPHWKIIGGGICGDTAAFAANLVGCEFSFVPTTLLAMADACVGGKTGVNYPPYGKNQVGRFAFPQSVEIYLSWLDTLSDEDFRSGLSECWKHAFLSGDQELLAKLGKVRSPNELNLATLEKVVQVKADVVAKDPTEKAERASLNFGHTLAHALEACAQNRPPVGSERPIAHGQAVAVGLVFAAHLSHAVSGLSEADTERIISALHSSNCLLPWPEVLRRSGLNEKDAWTQLREHLARDKKAKDGKTRWVLLESMGKVEPGSEGTFTVAVDDSKIEQAWLATIESLRNAPSS